MGLCALVCPCHRIVGPYLYCQSCRVESAVWRSYLRARATGTVENGHGSAVGGCSSRPSQDVDADSYDYEYDDYDYG